MAEYEQCSELQDGYIIKFDPDWGTAHIAASGDGIDDTIPEIWVATVYIPPEMDGGFYIIYRGFLHFDTSSIPPGATIIGAKLSLYPGEVMEDDAGYATLHIVEGVQAKPLELADYGNHLDKVVSGGSIAIGDWVPGSYNEIELNATGISWINKGGLTKFCLRVAADINDTPPTGENVVVFGAAEAGAGWCPKLTVTYTIAEVVAPTVTTDAATDITPTSATLKGILNSDGGEACEVRFQYGLTDAYGTDTAWQPGKVTDDTFEQLIGGLTPNTTYHFRAQAKNSAGTSNGADETFTTIVSPAITGARLRFLVYEVGGHVVGHDTIHIVEGVQHTPIIGTDFGDNKDKTVSGGSAPYGVMVEGEWIEIELNAIALGWINPTGITKFCVRFVDDKDNVVPTGQTYLSLFSIYEDGKAELIIDFEDGSSKTYCCGECIPPYEYCIASDYTGRIRHLGWKDTWAEAHDAASGDNIFTDSRIVILASLSGLGFNVSRGFVAFDTKDIGIMAPIVTTGAATDIEATSATLNGTLVDDGGEPCGCGFEWGETEAYEHGETTPQSKTTGESFSQAISGLNPGTTYHFRAPATNEAGTGYGADRTFATLPAPVPVLVAINRSYALSREEL